MIKSKIGLCIIFVSSVMTAILAGYTKSNTKNPVPKDILERSFEEHYELYNNEVMALSAEQIREATENHNYSGDGYLIWEGWKNIKKNNLLTGLLDVSLISDAVYTSMKLPSECTDYFMGYRTNPVIYDTHEDGYQKICGIGAFYPVYGEKLPDKFTLCVGKFMVFILRKDIKMGWEVFTEDTILRDIKNVQLRPLPWTLELSLEERRPKDKVFFASDHVEFNLSAEDLSANDEKPDGSVLHFYSSKLPIDTSEILATVVIYEMWSDTEEINNKVVATVGLDYWGDSSYQMFSGHSYYVTNEHRVVIGHNISDEMYLELVSNGLSPEQCLAIFNTTKTNILE